MIKYKDIGISLKKQFITFTLVYHKLLLSLDTHFLFFYAPGCRMILILKYCLFNIAFPAYFQMLETFIHIEFYALPKSLCWPASFAQLKQNERITSFRITQFTSWSKCPWTWDLATLIISTNFAVFVLPYLTSVRRAWHCATAV